MTTSMTSYKGLRSARVIQEPASFISGCYYTNQTVPTGFAKFLVNYDYTDDGQILKPRQGITNDAVLFHSNVNAESATAIKLGDAHVDGLLYYEDTTGSENLAETVLSLGNAYLFGKQGTTVGEIPYSFKQDYYYMPTINWTEADAKRIGESGWSILMDKRNLTQYLSRPYSLGHYKAEQTTTSVGLVKAKVYNNLNIFNTETDNFQIIRPVLTTHGGYVYTICTSYMEVVDDAVTCADPTMRLSRIRLKEEAGTDGSTFNPIRDVVSIKHPSVAEATTVGYNMLLDEPYEFPNVQGSTRVQGIVPYEPDDTASGPFGKVLFSANNGEKIRLNCVYSFETGATYQIKWEYKSQNADTFTVLKDFTAFTAGVSNFAYYDLIPTDAIFTIRVTIRKNAEATSDQLGFLSNYQIGLDDLKNLNNDTFNLNTATGMFSFNNMLGLYGVEGAETALFFSDIDNPGYFPFPQNQHSFDEQILKVVNYLDALIIITTNSIYTITGSGLPSNFVVKKLITNLNITELDADLIKVIKDQIFFKADNTFFVLKPNTYTGDSTDLRNYEVSKAINTYLQDFTNNTLDLFNSLYPLRLTEPSLNDLVLEPNRYLYNRLYVVGYNQHVVDGKLQIVVRLELTCDTNNISNETRLFKNTVDLTLVYDTLNKQWYAHTFNLLNTCALRHRRGDNQNLLMFDNTIKDGKQYLIIAKYDTNPKDYYSAMLDGIHFEITPALPNWQAIYSGNINMNNQLFKRLREMQFTVDNRSGDTLKFYANVYADGVNVFNSNYFVTEHITDVNDEDYGHIYINEYDAPNVEIAGTTSLDNWELDFSHFPNLTYIRTHVRLTGKGRFISYEVFNRDEKKYELSNTIWVLRYMNAR